MKQLGVCLVLGVLVGCSKSQPSAAPATSASNQSGALANASPSSAAQSAAPMAPAAPTAAATPSSAPASFKGGTRESIGDAVGLGCEATSLDGWLQLLCRKKNGTGGHPLHAVIHGGSADDQKGDDGSENAVDDAANGEQLAANEQGELTIVVPWSGNEKRDVEIEWTDTTYTLHVTGPKATLEWAASGVPHRKACQQLQDESKAVLAAAQKAEGEARLTTSEATKYSHFGVCKPAGLGSWALALKAISGKGEAAARLHQLELNVVRVEVDGARMSTRFGSFDVAPGGFELAALQTYDYDDDGHDELIVPYELRAAAGTAPTFAAPIWSFSSTGITAYAKAPTVGGGIGVEQLEFDMRPDFSTYGAFVAYLGTDCGLKACPPRLTGPKLFLHSLPNGSFTASDETTQSALKRASCQNKPPTVVVEAGGTLNAVQTAKNLVCARAWGVTSEAIAAELTSKHAALCGEAATCPVQSTFEAWLELPLPVDLSTSAKK